MYLRIWRAEVVLNMVVYAFKIEFSQQLTERRLQVNDRFINTDTAIAG